MILSACLDKSHSDIYDRIPLGGKIIQWVLPTWVKREGVPDSYCLKPLRSYFCRMKSRSPDNFLGCPLPRITGYRGYTRTGQKISRPSRLPESGSKQEYEMVSQSQSQSESVRIWQSFSAHPRRETALDNFHPFKKRTIIRLYFNHCYLKISLQYSYILFVLFFIKDLGEEFCAILLCSRSWEYLSNYRQSGNLGTPLILLSVRISPSLSSLHRTSQQWVRIIVSYDRQSQCSIDSTVDIATYLIAHRWYDLWCLSEILGTDLNFFRSF